MRRSSAKPVRTPGQLRRTVQATLAELQRLSSAKVRAGMARYGIPSHNAWGVGVGQIQKYGRQLGRNQSLAEALWDTGVYEARMLAAFVGDPVHLTPAAMERWCRDFDSWAIVDTVCFKLFDQSPHAWKMVALWSKRKGEFQKRAGFVLLACLAAHSEDVPDKVFLRHLPLLERGAADERHFVKKGVSWALRMIGRQSPGLRTAVAALARRLAASGNPSSRWVGREVLRHFR